MKEVSNSCNAQTLSEGDYFVKPLPPYIPQFASRKLISEFLDKQMNTGDDPLRESFGFETIEDYDFWTPRLCGLVCVKMVLDALSPRSAKETVAELTNKAVSFGGYKVYDDAGTFVDKGWVYAPLIVLAKEYGVSGNVCTDLTILDLCDNVLNNIFSIASVNPQVIRGDIDKCETKGGHLVVVLGFKWNGKDCEGFYVHNSSGRVPSTQEKSFVPFERFVESFAQRGLTMFLDNTNSSHIKGD